MTIKDYVKLKHITLELLATELGCSTSYLSKVSNGNIKPREDIRTILLGLGIDDLPISYNEQRQKSQERIQYLVKENRALKKELKVLKESVIPKIEELLRKIGVKYE
jgi:transcriptional regulator with XRE-family HTH domain